jgi:hypothetical protein
VYSVVRWGWWIGECRGVRCDFEFKYRVLVEDVGEGVGGVGGSSCTIPTSP